MIAFLILFVPCAILAFLLALFLRRGWKFMALMVGTLPAALLAWGTTETLGDPLTWIFILAFFWLPALAGAFGGGWLGRRLAGRRAAA